MRQRAAIAVFLGVLAAPGLNMILHAVPEVHLAGATVDAARPAIAWKALVRGDYQKQFEDWLNATVGFRGLAVLLDNSISYHVFGETPTGSRVVVGRNGTLFVDEDIQYERDRRPVAPAEITALAQQLKRMQDRLRDKGKTLIPIVVPSKTVLFPDAIPAAWRAEARTAKSRYQVFQDALIASGVQFVDGHQLLVEEQRRRRTELFSLPGRHWNRLGACLVLSRAIALAHRDDLRAPDCTVVEQSLSTVDDPDYDLYQLMNAWLTVPAAWLTPKMRPVDASRGTARALFVGTSFAWTLVRESERNALFREIHLYYYNRTAFDRQNDTHWPIDPATPAWRELTLAKDVYILDLPEMYVPSVGGDFLTQLEHALQ